MSQYVVLNINLDEEQTKENTAKCFVFAKVQEREVIRGEQNRSLH